MRERFPISRFHCALIAVIYALVTPVLVAQSAKSKPVPEWKQYIFNKDDFAMEFPAAPNPHPDAQVPQMTAYSARLTESATLTLRVGPRPPDCESVLERLRSGALTSHDEQLLGSSMRNVVGPDETGFEYEWRTAGYRGYSRFECGPARIYAFTSTWHLGEPKPPALERMINSFHPLKTSPRKNQ